MRLLAFLALLAGCGSDDDGGGTPDAPPYDTAKCLIKGLYGDLGAQTGNSNQGPTTLTVTLDAGPPKDSFFLKLTTGKGVFAGGLANGTYTIAGADADFNNCGLCTNIIADISTQTGPAKFYFATSGSVTLTNTQPPTGTLSNVSFVEVLTSGMVVPGGCIAKIDAMTFGPP